METLYKIAMFFVLFLALVGCIGTCGWLIYEKAFVILVGALFGFSFGAKPWFEKVKELLNN